VREMASVRMAVWECKYCGSRSNVPAFFGHCSKSPDKKHKWVELVSKKKM